MPFVQCKICKKSVRPRSIVSHGKTHDDAENTSCPTCDRPVRTASLPLHLLKHKDPKEVTPEEMKRFQKHFCPICNTFNVSLKSHNQRNHTAQSLLPCTICGEPIRRDLMHTHITWKHTGPFQCALCDRKFSTKTRIKKHLEEMHLHTKTKPVCKVCGKMFNSVAVLRSHTISRHQSPKFICNECGKQFPFKTTLAIHMEAVHTQSKSVVCRECGAKYNTKSALDYHISTSHSSNEKYGKFYGSCVCGVTLFSRASFTQHIKTEHRLEDGRYHCPCGRNYHSKPCLTTHFQRCHKISWRFEREPKNKKK